MQIHKSFPRFIEKKAALLGYENGSAFYCNFIRKLGEMQRKGLDLYETMGVWKRGHRWAFEDEKLWRWMKENIPLGPDQGIQKVLDSTLWEFIQTPGLFHLRKFLKMFGIKIGLSYNSARNVHVKMKSSGADPRKLAGIFMKNNRLVIENPKFGEWLKENGYLTGL